MPNADPSKSITFHARDIGGQVYNVLLRVEEHAASGLLVITPEAGAPQEYPLTQIRKSRDCKTVRCHTGAATVTLSIEESYTPPHLHLVAQVFFPVVDATYTLSQVEQEHLVAWVRTLRLHELA